MILSEEEDNFQIKRQSFYTKVIIYLSIDVKFSNKVSSLKVKFSLLSKLSLIFLNDNFCNPIRRGR